MLVLNLLGGLWLALGPDTIDSDRSIVGGVPTDTGTFEGVVGVVTPYELCTGTLIHPEVVLTAGHCLAAITNADSISIIFGDSANIPDHHIAAAAIGTHPDFCPSCDQDIHDFGYVQLATPADVESVIPPIITQSVWDDFMHVGLGVTLLGYGLDPNAEFESVGRKRIVKTVLFEQSVSGSEFLAGGRQKDSCRGDSGGPALAQTRDGQWMLIGVTSRGSDPCGEGGIYGVPYAALDWIQEQTEISLCGDDCDTCDCVDTSPPPSPSCTCSTLPRNAIQPSPLWLMVFPLIRRRARPSTYRSLAATAKTRGRQAREMDQTEHAAP